MANLNHTLFINKNNNYEFFNELKFEELNKQIKIL